MNQDNRNFFLAIALSILVIVGWQYFYAAPQLDKTRQTQAELAKPSTAPTPGSPDLAPAASPAAPPQGGVTPSTSPAEVPKTREEALAASPRVKLDTKSLSGSIALKGARIDDVSLKGYRETTDPRSPIITLLSPSGGPSPFYAELGFVGGAHEELPKADTLWTADGDVLSETKPLTLTYDNGQGLVFHRKIAVDDRYMFTVTDEVTNMSGAPVTLYPYALVSRHGKPVTSGYSVLHEGMIGVIGDAVEEPTYDSIEKETKATKTLDGTGGWLGFTDKYWSTVVIPDQQAPFEGRFFARGTSFKIYQADFRRTEGIVIAQGASAETSARVFAGAKEVQTLNTYQDTLGIKKFNLMIDWGYFWMITQPMFSVLDWIYKFTGNFGIAILITTVLVKVLFFPLANRSYLSMAKMKAMQPQMAAIRERYPDDKMKQQQETMELYKREKINPVAGCLPMLIQIPVFFALYKVLFITIEMRQAPFFGWIKDLSQPDPTNVFNLFGLLPYDPTHLPLIGHFLAIGIWPLIMGFSMFLQMKMNPEPPDPVQRQMFTWMPVIFTFMLGTFPSGLVIYWTWNNTLSVLQQSFIMRRAGVKVELWDNLSNMFRKKAAT
jgi:YidC/Oxa1 family membrane protein insertase